MLFVCRLFFVPGVLQQGAITDAYRRLWQLLQTLTNVSVFT